MVPDNMTTERILVTGGAGFLGSHLCDRLVALGAEVTCVDNFLTGDLANLNQLKDKSTFEVVRHDVTAPLFRDADKIFNLACPASPIHYQADPVHTMKTSVFGALNMLGLAKRTNARILQASTSEVYGDPEVHPQTEQYLGRVNPIGIRSCYDEGKRSAESLFFDYWRQHAVRIKVLRIFNTYGPRMSLQDGRVVSSFIAQALRGEDITLYGDGQQTRSFCYVDDMIDAMMLMMDTGDGVTGPFNVGNPYEVTMLELAEVILNLTSSRSKLTFRPLPHDDPRRRQPDITLARETLGWRPKVGLRDGLKETIAHFKRAIATASDRARRRCTLVRNEEKKCETVT